MPRTQELATYPRHLRTGISFTAQAMRPWILTTLTSGIVYVASLYVHAAVEHRSVRARFNRPRQPSAEAENAGAAPVLTYTSPTSQMHTSTS